MGSIGGEEGRGGAISRFSRFGLVIGRGRVTTNRDES